MERASELVEARLAPSPITPQVAGASALPAMAQMVPMVSDVSGGVQPTAVRMRYQIAAYLAVGATVLLILFVCAMLTRLVQSSGLDPHTSGLYPSGAPHCPRPLPYLWAVPLGCSPLPASSAIPLGCTPRVLPIARVLCHTSGLYPSSAPHCPRPLPNCPQRGLPLSSGGPPARGLSPQNRSLAICKRATQAVFFMPGLLLMPLVSMATTLTSIGALLVVVAYMCTPDPLLSAQPPIERTRPRRHRCRGLMRYAVCFHTVRCLLSRCLLSRCAVAARLDELAGTAAEMATEMANRVSPEMWIEPHAPMNGLALSVRIW